MVLVQYDGVSRVDYTMLIVERQVYIAISDPSSLCRNFET